MRLIICRHGDPDYEKDSLTETGWLEAELLAQRLAKLKIDEVYVSPLGRAQATAGVTLKKIGMEGVTLDWLTEFIEPNLDPESGEPRIVSWDLVPRLWMDDDRNFDEHHWADTEYIQTAPVYEHSQRVYKGLDEVLAKHGYIRHGRYYKTEQGNEDTVVLFCHFGVQAVMLSHLLNISPIILWHMMGATPTSVTTIITEEREKGDVMFRMQGYGDVSHLYAAGREPSFAGRFCEVYENFDQRHV